MFETMQNAKEWACCSASGVSVRLFIIDASPYVIEDEEDDDEEEDTEDLKISGKYLSMPIMNKKGRMEIQ